jgi:hypothetical protein
MSTKLTIKYQSDDKTGAGFHLYEDLPNSRLGEGDHCVTDGQARIATVKTRDQHDRITVQEKLDGSNAKLSGCA